MLQVSEVTNVNSVLPGALVQCLITAVHPTGLNLQILGFFDGTVDQLHMRDGAVEKAYKIGKKIKARILYDFSSTPPRFALALSSHIVALRVRRINGGKDARGMQDGYPLGTILEAVKVLRLEAERGATVEIEPGFEGFVHVRLFSSVTSCLSPTSYSCRYLICRMIMSRPFRPQGTGNQALSTGRELPDISPLTDSYNFPSNRQSSNKNTFK